MDVTARLVEVFHVDKQLRGLKSRLVGAEKFLADQDKDLTSLEGRRSGLDADLKKASAQAADAEGEMKRLDAKMATIRSQMDNAQNNKEYKAFLTELNTYKADRDKHEATALEFLGKAEEFKKQIAELAGRKDDREKVRKVAVSDRDARSNEIADRVRELEAQRAALVAQVPTEVMRDLQKLIDRRGDEAVGMVEIVDVKRHEFNCGVCMMSLPVDAVAMLASSGRLTRCASCQCVLYIDQEGKELIQNGGKPAKKPKAAPKAGKKAKKEEEVAG
jgi:predicted  nucleic acid-binding Zn-ribbon protein